MISPDARAAWNPGLPTLDRPLDRRRFLRQATAGAALVTTAGALWPAAVRAAREDRPELKLLVVTDTHLGYRDQEHAARQWEQTAAALKAAPGDVVLHLGDVVDGGREPQYGVYREIRESIGKQVHEIPGNHDPAELFARQIRSQIDHVVDCDWLRIVLLNDARPESHDGFVSPEQLRWLDEEFRRTAADGRLAAVAMHVPAHSNRHPDRGWHVKPGHGQAEFYELLQAHSATVLCLLHGHFHNGVRGWDDRRPLYELSFPSALYNQDRRLTEQGAAGFNLPEFRPGFVRLKISGQGLQLGYQTLPGGEVIEKRLPFAAE